MALAIRLASPSEAAFFTVMRTRLVVPSPSSMSISDRRASTARRASSKAARSFPAVRGVSDPDERMMAVSLVDMSPSMLMAFSVGPTQRLNIAVRSSAPTGASVMMKQRSVAMFGAIMPAPLAVPATRKSPAEVVKETQISFGTVSVVMMARGIARPPSRLEAGD